MPYLDALDVELRGEGIPRRRRRRIIAEFADHLHEDLRAELGSPRDLARQFAAEVGTRLARRVALVAFAGLAVTGVACALSFLMGTRGVLLPPTVRQIGARSRPLGWVEPLWVLSAQVAFAAGVLALLRAWRLRRAPVITGRDAQILYRRAGVGLLAGAVTAGFLPVGISAGPGAVYLRSERVGALCLLMLLLMLVFAMLAGRVRPRSQGAAADLRFDLGMNDPRVTPWRVAFALSGAILVVLAGLGIATDDPYDGIARGIADAAACLAGFALLGPYLGLRTTVNAAQ